MRGCALHSVLLYSVEGEGFLFLRGDGVLILNASQEGRGGGGGGVWVDGRGYYFYRRQGIGR